MPRSSSRPPPLGAVAQLSEQEAAAVAYVGIVHPELMAVVAQRQRLREIVGQRLEAAEMADPLLVVERGEADRFGRAVVAEPRIACGKSAGSTGRKGVAELEDGGLGR